jgi:TolB protein
MTDKREELLSAFIDDEQASQAADWDPELAAMADVVQRIRSARTYEPPSFDFAQRGWQHIVEQTRVAEMERPVGRIRANRRKRAGWVATAASLLAVAVLIATQPWSQSPVSASEIRVTGSGVLVDLGVEEALYPRYAGSLDTVSYGNGEDRVWLWNRAEKKAAEFPPAFSYMRDAAWSPDGKRVAFTGYKSALPGPSSPALWIADRDGSHPTLVVKPADPDTAYESPAWSPDGSRIAFTATRATLSDATGVVNESSVQAVNVDGSGLTTVAAKGKQPTWSRNGKEIAYAVENSEGGSEIWIVQADGEQGRKLTTGQMPAWSPTRPFLVFTRTRAEHRQLLADAQGKESFGADISYDELWAVNVESGTETRLTQSEYPQELVERMLAESDGRGDTSAVYAVSGVTSDEQAAWSPDGTRILFTRNTMEEQGRHFTLQELKVEYK